MFLFVPTSHPVNSYVSSASASTAPQMHAMVTLLPTFQIVPKVLATQSTYRCNLGALFSQWGMDKSQWINTSAFLPLERSFWDVFCVVPWTIPGVTELYLSTTETGSGMNLSLPSSLPVSLPYLLHSAFHNYSDLPR